MKSFFLTQSISNTRKARRQGLRWDATAIVPPPLPCYCTIISSPRDVRTIILASSHFIFTTRIIKQKLVGYVRFMETSNSLRSRVTDADVTSFRGLLSSGFKVEMSLTFLGLLSSPTCPFLEELGKQLSFETVVGLNGWVWVCS
ncbi:hypothetical protein WN943_027534 [Citrus x changshan-huyou]